MAAGTIATDLDRLRIYIDAAEAAGTARLPPEPKLCETLGISRGRLRTLLKRLEGEGAIWRHVGKGTFIGQRMAGADAQGWLASVSVNHLFDARLVLEPQCAALAAMHAAPRDIKALEQCLADMQAAPSFLAWRRLDDRLHRLIAEATHNALLLLLHDTLRLQIRDRLDKRVEDVHGASAAPRAATNDEHAALLAAIRSHHPQQAKAAMRKHLRAVRMRLFELSLD